MDFRLLAQNGENLEKYFTEYCKDKDFLINYYLQDPERISCNFSKYAVNIPTEEIVSFLNRLADMGVDNTIIGHAFYYSMVYAPNDKIELLRGASRHLLDLERQGQFSLEGIEPAAAKFINQSDPLYILKKDIINIRNLGKITDENVVIDVLKYCIENNYSFTKEETFFIKDSVLINDRVFFFFVNNCSFDGDITRLIDDRINQLKDSKEQLRYFYNEIKNESVKKNIRTILNMSNYDINTIIRDEKIFLKLDGNEEEIIAFLNKAKEEHFDTDIVLIMDRVNLEFSEKAYSIYGDRLRISPIENQEHVPNDVWEYQDYSLEYIKKCESRLNMYADCVRDTYDIDGDVKSLSPLEKYIAAYIMVCKFGLYKAEDPEERDDYSRSVYEVIGQDDKTKIVCAGYAALLREILYRMGIEDTIEWSVYAPSEGDVPFENNIHNHARIMVHLKDPKYDLDVIFMADPTWDSHDLERHLYEHIMMTADKLFEIDPELNPRYLHLDDLQFKGKELNADNVNELFNKTIPQECIVKAFTAVRYFLERDKKMVADGDYPAMDLDETAKTFGLVDRIELDDDKLDKMTLRDYPDAFGIYGVDFIHNIRPRFNNFLKENGVDIKVSLIDSGVVVPLDDKVPVDVLIQNGYKVDLEKKRVYLCSYDLHEEILDSKVNVFFDYALMKIKEYQGLVANLESIDESFSK